MFWEMHDLLFANHNELSPQDLRRYAESLGLNLDMFDEDMRHGRLAARVEDDAVDAETSEVNGTPTFYLAYGAATPRRHHGPYDAAALIVALEQLRFEADQVPEPAPDEPGAPLWTVPVYPADAASPATTATGTGADEAAALRRFAGGDAELADRVDEIFAHGFDNDHND